MSTPKSHNRGPSTDERRRVKPRSSTKGPLDLLDPLGSPIPSNASSPSLASPNIGSLTPDIGIEASEPIYKPNLDFLLRPEIYHPLSHLDIPSAFLVYADQSSGATNNLRAVAVNAVQELLKPATDYHQIFALLYVRLSALVLINATSLAAREAKALEDFNAAVVYRNPSTGAHLAPWELRVLVVRLQSIGFNDWRRGIMGIYELAREARIEWGKGDDAEKAMWQARLNDLSIRTAGTLIEMGDIEGAIRHLQDFLAECSELAPRIKMALALLYIRCGSNDEVGDLLEEDQLSGGEQGKGIIAALELMSNGDFVSAAEVWRGILEIANDPLIRQNLAVCLLYNGEMENAQTILEELIDDCEPFYALTFNLCTIYELCYDRSKEMKLKLAERVAKRNPEAEVYNSDFKL